MTIEERLKEKALALPHKPGVYIMMDKSGEVIYVGKAKSLKNRVNQYFQDSGNHTPKTLKMIAQIHDFDVIIAKTEFEALVLENNLIKRHMPKYNILLKDDKGYPYVRVNLKEEYPRFTLVSKMSEDGAKYFGPYGGRVATQNAIDTVLSILKLPTCSRKFPKDIGRGRPCLNYHMGRCLGYCRSGMEKQEYKKAAAQAALIFEGKLNDVSSQILREMEQASEELQFERAAQLRDRHKAIENLNKKQNVISGSMADTDAVGYFQGEAKSCFAVLHYIGGVLLEKDYEILETPIESGREEIVSSLVRQYYLGRSVLPKTILLPCEIEDGDLVAQLLLQNTGKSVHILSPKRGEKAALVELANSNAREEAELVTTKEERVSKTLELIGNMLGLDHPPRRIEAYDVSNISGSDVVGGMTVFINGQPLKRDYKRFKMKQVQGQDDYHSMTEMLCRRFQRLLNGDSGFAETPDLLLIDGGQAHAAAVKNTLFEMGISAAVFGMVKDDRHRTRALVSPDGREIGISAVQAAFVFIGKIQEETHRFAITYHKSLRNKRVKQSVLDNINGVGDTRRIALINHFKTIKNIKEASLDQLCQAVPKNTAKAIYDYFHGEGDEK